MSLKEVNQLEVFARLKAKEITQKQAAEMLGISTRQVRKKYKRYEKYGAKGLIHRSRGKPSPRKLPKELLNKIFELYDSRYSDFGPTLFAEMLETKHGIKISIETLRKYLIKSGRWKKSRKRKRYFKRRERRKHIGILVQIDGSIHDWFEGRGPKCTILLGIDDSTGEILFLEFYNIESTKNYMRAFKNYIQKYGRPISIYVDYHSVFNVNLNNKERDKLTQFGRAMQQLGIRVILASSPQAKGRVERANKTLQDILVKFLRINNISDIASANIYAQEFFIGYFNEKFSKRTSKHTDVHRSIAGYNLEDIFSVQETRILCNDYTITYNKRIFQLDKYQRAILKPKDEILVQKHLNDTLTLKIRNIPLEFTEISVRHIGKLKPVEFVNQTREKEKNFNLSLLGN